MTEDIETAEDVMAQALKNHLLKQIKTEVAAVLAPALQTIEILSRQVSDLAVQLASALAKPPAENKVVVNVPSQAAPVVNVNVPKAQMPEAPVVVNNISPTPVEVKNEMPKAEPKGKAHVTLYRDEKGRLESFDIE